MPPPHKEFGGGGGVCGLWGWGPQKLKNHKNCSRQHLLYFHPCPASRYVIFGGRDFLWSLWSFCGLLWSFCGLWDFKECMSLQVCFIFLWKTSIYFTPLWEEAVFWSSVLLWSSDYLGFSRIIEVQHLLIKYVV